MKKKYLNVKQIPCLIFEIVKEVISEGGWISRDFKGILRNT